MSLAAILVGSIAAVNKTPRVRIPVPLHPMGELTERINNQ
jgi:hypothetical protein